MKNVVLWMALSLVFTGTVMAKEVGQREQMVSMNDAYIPSGFDSGSDSFAVVSGLFPNSCYKFRDAKVEHVGPSLHEVRAYATVTQGMCLMVLVPFNHEVQLGKLAVGDHSIHFLNGDGTYWEKHLVIEQ